MALSPIDYLRRDFRVKCLVCGRLMRRRPTAKTPAERRPDSDAGCCTGCRPLLPEVLVKPRGQEPSQQLS
jgi:hypothetical protein